MLTCTADIGSHEVLLYTDNKTHKLIIRVRRGRGRGRYAHALNIKFFYNREKHKSYMGERKEGRAGVHTYSGNMPTHTRLLKQETL